MSTLVARIGFKGRTLSMIMSWKMAPFAFVASRNFWYSRHAGVDLRRRRTHVDWSWIFPYTEFHSQLPFQFGLLVHVLQLGLLLDFISQLVALDDVARRNWRFSLLLAFLATRSRAFLSSAACFILESSFCWL